MPSNRINRYPSALAHGLAVAAVCLSCLPATVFADRACLQGRAYLQDRAPAPYTVDGQLRSNAKDYGYYPTKWKRWPGTGDQSRDGQGPPPPSTLPKSDVPTKEEEDKAMPKPDRATNVAPRAGATTSTSEDKAPELPLDLTDPAPSPPEDPTRPDSRTRNPDPRRPGPPPRGRTQPAPDGTTPPRGAQPSGLPNSTIPQSLDDVFPIDPGGSTLRQPPAIRRGLSNQPIRRAEYQSPAKPTRIAPREPLTEKRYAENHRAESRRVESRRAEYRSPTQYQRSDLHQTKTADVSTRVQLRIAQPKPDFVRQPQVARDTAAMTSPSKGYARSSDRLAQPRPISPPADPAPSFSVQGEHDNPLRPRGPSFQTTQEPRPSYETQIRPVAHYQPIDAAPVLPVAKSLGAKRGVSNNPLRSQ